jgi:YfiH family protein
MPLETPTLIQSPVLEPYRERLRYGFTTKPYFVGGSEAGHDELLRHRTYWLHALGMGRTRHPLRFPVQVHGDAYFLASQVYSQAADAIVLDEPNLPAVVFSADCTPVLLYAPDIHQAALVHCGWKSTALGLAAKMASYLVSAGADASQLRAVIGPALSQNGFEIDADVQTTLASSMPADLPAHLWSRHDVERQKYYASVPEVNRQQLLAVGVQPAHMDCLPYATDTHPELFWSFRAGDWQRQGSFMMLLDS